MNPAYIVLYLSGIEITNIFKLDSARDWEIVARALRHLWYGIYQQIEVYMALCFFQLTF